MSHIQHGLTTEEAQMYRRGFLGRLAATAAAGVAGLTPLRLEAQPTSHQPITGAVDPSFETWLNRITGKHKMLFDAPEVNGGMPVVWPRVWLNGNNENYATKDGDNSAVIVLRHSAIPIAMQDALWAKYKLGEVFGIKDGETLAVRNIFADVMPLPLPGTGLKALLASGAQVGCCNVALTVYSGMVAQKMSMDAAAVKAEWVAGLLPGVQVVPSGVLAVARSQEKGCVYCFAG
jgi:intracellular sulfur oxidation DsrE/DsrF family protein